MRVKESGLIIIWMKLFYFYIIVCHPYLWEIYLEYFYIEKKYICLFNFVIVTLLLLFININLFTF